MQTITYAHDRTHFQGTGWIVPFDIREWNWLEVKSLIWAQKGKLYIIYEKVMWILGILRFIYLFIYALVSVFQLLKEF
jgi:hypothetical protein